MQVRVAAHAKINLTLEVLGARSDGYHELRSIVVPVTLADWLEVTPLERGIVTSDSGYGDNDLIVKAAMALRGGNDMFGAAIKLEKHIAVGGGLGGGSADAAAALLALNDIWNVGMLPEKLASIGAKVGSDVPALVLANHYHRPVLMEGRGEKVTILEWSDLLPVTPRIGQWIVLANPKASSSTAEVYALWSDGCRAQSKSANDLQAAATRLHPEIADALSALTAAGARDAMMTGSGATVFGFADDEPSAKAIAEKTERHGFASTVVRPLTNGVAE